MSTILIATDEAGYGPKLGPLVITATVWEIPIDSPDLAKLVDLFAPLRTPHESGSGTVVVDDSKAVFKSSHGLTALHTAVSAAMRWCGYQSQTLQQWLPEIAADDARSISQTPWFEDFGGQPFLTAAEAKPLVGQWICSGLKMTQISSRIISARQFNSQCVQGCNKADLLSEATIDLVRSLITLSESDSHVTVFCDRHGGRRYYGSVLQHSFPEWQLRVIDESRHCSRYQLASSDHKVDFAFTVKGDSFTPVALSSMISKYLRERLMGALNHYFSLRHRGDDPLRPTAGYPVRRRPIPAGHSTNLGS